MNKIKLSEINTSLFTNVQLTSFGVRFIYCDTKKADSMRCPQNLMYNFIIEVNIKEDGSVNILYGNHNNHLSFEQLQEIARVSEMIRGIKDKVVNEIENNIYNSIMSHKGELKKQDVIDIIKKELL